MPKKGPSKMLGCNAGIENPADCDPLIDDGC